MYYINTNNNIEIKSLLIDYAIDFERKLLNSEKRTVYSK